MFASLANHLVLKVWKDFSAPKMQNSRVDIAWDWLTCAATVCDLVGNSLVTQAVLNPLSTRPIAARSPAPPAPTTTASYV